MIQLEAEHDMLIDGKVFAGGSDATHPGMGGGSGGSIYITARYLSGLCDTWKITKRYILQKEAIMTHA